MGDYDFGQSRKEKYVGPGTGSITITPDRKGYSKTGSGKRMNIQEQEKTKWVSGNVHGDVTQTTSPAVSSGGNNRGGKEIVPRHTDRFYTPFIMRTQGGRDIPEDVWTREKYWGTYDETRRLPHPKGKKQWPEIIKNK